MELRDSACVWSPGVLRSLLFPLVSIGSQSWDESRRILKYTAKYETFHDVFLCIQRFEFLYGEILFLCQNLFVVRLCIVHFKVINNTERCIAVRTNRSSITSNIVEVQATHFLRGCFDGDVCRISERKCRAVGQRGKSRRDDDLLIVVSLCGSYFAKTAPIISSRKSDRWEKILFCIL